MSIIGVTGQICSGKTTASKVLEKKGALRIDVDKVGHDVLKKAVVKQKLLKVFGENIFEKRKVDRSKLAEMVFSDKTKMQSLCKIVHPIMKKEVIAKIKKSRRKNIVVDAALLIEMGLDKYMDKILVITVKKSVQTARAKKRKIKEVDLKKRMKFQLPLKAFLEVADVVIANNNCSKTFTKHILDNIRNLRYII